MRTRRDRQFSSWDTLITKGGHSCSKASGGHQGQRFPTFWAPDTSFVEDSSSTDQGVQMGLGWFKHVTFINPWVMKIPWRKKWQPMPVFLPGKSHEQRSLEGYSPRGSKESDTTEWLHFHYPPEKTLGGCVYERHEAWTIKSRTPFLYSNDQSGRRQWHPTPVLLPGKSQTEEPGRLQSMGSLRVGHDWASSLSLFTFTLWRRKWQPIPVLLPGKSHGRRSLVGCRLWGHTESDTTEVT